MQEALDEQVPQAEVAPRAAAYHRVLGDAGGVIIELDERGSVTHVSPSIQSVLGYSPDEVLQHGSSDWIHEQDRKRLLEQFAKMFSSGDSEQTSCRLRHADGSWKMWQAPGALDPSVIWSEIGLRGRSMLEIMQVASKQVQAPGLDASTAGGRSDWLVIRSSESEPDNRIRIRQRGLWFYIDDSDTRSQKSFAMLNALFAVIGGTVPGAAPVMTIPVGL